MAHFLKHVHGSRISYWCIQDNGVFVNVTITTRSITQQIGRIDNENDDYDRRVWIQRLKDVGQVVEKVEFDQVQDWYAKNGSRMFHGEIEIEELRRFINERNLYFKVDRRTINQEGQYGLEW